MPTRCLCWWSTPRSSAVWWRRYEYHQNKHAHTHSHTSQLELACSPYITGVHQSKRRLSDLGRVNEYILHIRLITTRYFKSDKLNDVYHNSKYCFHISLHFKSSNTQILGSIIDLCLVICCVVNGIFWDAIRHTHEVGGITKQRLDIGDDSDYIFTYCCFQWGSILAVEAETSAKTCTTSSIPKTPTSRKQIGAGRNSIIFDRFYNFPTIPMCAHVCTVTRPRVSHTTPRGH